MKIINHRELQLLELNILEQFAKFCDQNNLKYFLDSGTLIGAIRHSGFIPWDDDIDVCFLRSDYERFIKIMRERNYYLTSYIKLSLEKDSLYPYIKLVDTRTVLIEYPQSNPTEIGVYIDIFPKDGLKSKQGPEKRRAKKVKFYNSVSWLRLFTSDRLIRTRRGINLFIAFCIRMIITDGNKFKEKSIALAKKYNNEECKYVSSIVCSGLIGCVEKECFEEQIDVIFEGKVFKAPIGYDSYLRSLYTGDYMTPPSIESRQSHDTIVYWK